MNFWLLNSSLKLARRNVHKLDKTNNYWNKKIQSSLTLWAVIGQVASFAIALESIVQTRSAFADTPIVNIPGAYSGPNNPATAIGNGFYSSFAIGESASATSLTRASSVVASKTKGCRLG